MSQASKKLILRELKHVRPSQIDVVYGAANTQFNPLFARLEFKRVREAHRLPKRYFIYAGEAIVRKNLATLIRGFQIVRAQSPELSLVMAGFSPDELRGHIQSTDPGCDLTNVKAIGYVPCQDLPSLYYGAIALVYPSYDEGFGLPIVEAMSTGQVIVTSDIAATREITNEVAFFADPASPDSIREQLLNALLLSDEKRQGLIERGRQVSGRYSWEKSAQLMLTLFEAGFRAKSSR